MNTYLTIVSSNSIEEVGSALVCNASISFEGIVASADAPPKCWIAVAAPRGTQPNFQIIGLLSGFSFSQGANQLSATLASCNWEISFGLRNGINTCPYAEIQRVLNDIFEANGPEKAVRVDLNTERRIASIAAFQQELVRQSTEHATKQANPGALYSTTRIKCPKCSHNTAYLVKEDEAVTRTLAHGRYRKDGGLDERYNSEFKTSKSITRTLLCSSCRHQWHTRTQAGCLAAIVAIVTMPLVVFFS